MKEKTKTIYKGSGGGAVYCLGLIGVFIYYFPTINSIGQFFTVIIKSIFWPAFLLYQVYGSLGMS